MNDDDKAARYADDANIPPEREHDTHEAETLPAPPSEGAPEVAPAPYTYDPESMVVTARADRHLYIYARGVPPLIIRE